MPTIEEARLCKDDKSHVINQVEVLRYSAGYTQIRYVCGVCDASGTMGLYADGLNWNETAFGYKTPAGE